MYDQHEYAVSIAALALTHLCMLYVTLYGMQA